MKYLFLIVLLASVIGAWAQQPGKDPSGAVLQRCLLSSTEATWAKLKLTPDQLRRMGYIQEACRDVCGEAGVKVTPNPISDEDGATILGEMRNVLSRDQYDAWIAQCTGGAH